MPDHKIVCVKCGSAVVARLNCGSGNAYVATCQNLFDHGAAYGNTSEEAIDNYAKDQAWGMEKLKRLEDYENIEKNAVNWILRQVRGV